MTIVLLYYYIIRFVIRKIQFMNMKLNVEVKIFYYIIILLHYRAY